MSPASFLGLEGKTVLITGATSGIGRETAIQASRHGAIIALLARRGGVLNQVLESLEGAGHIAKEYDLADTDGIPAVMQEISAELGGLDGLVHAAGIHSTIPLRSVQPHHSSEVFHLNVTAALMLAKGFRHKTVRGNEPSIVFLSSVAGLVGQAGGSVYSASKGAIVTLTKSLAIELAREGIRVNCLCPGVVETEMTNEFKTRISSETFEHIRSLHPLGLGNATDVANSALFLLSGASRWMTGAAVSLDGGYTAQ